MIAWVKGNDILVNLILTRKTGEGTENFLLDSCDSWSVTVNNKYGNSFDCPYSKSGENVIALDLPDTLPLGDYDIIFTAVLNGRDIRAVELCLFRVVSHNALANVPIGERLEGETSADIDIAIEVPTQSISEGKNSYQLWLEAGHTGSLEDFLSWVRTDYDGLASVVDGHTTAIEELQLQMGDIATILDTINGEVI